MTAAPTTPPTANDAGSKYRRQLAIALVEHEDHLRWLVQHVSPSRCDVVPWVAVENLIKSSNHIAYLAGMVNGCRMARFDEPPNSIGKPQNCCHIGENEHEPKT